VLQTFYEKATSPTRFLNDVDDDGGDGAVIIIYRNLAKAMFVVIPAQPSRLCGC
jgi:hypothetical protein